MPTVAAICRWIDYRGICHRIGAPVVVGMLLLSLAACGADSQILPEEDSRPGMGSLHPDADATDARFLGIGCVLTAVSDSGTILVPMKGGSPWRRYDCPEVTREAISTAYRSHMEWLTADESGAVPALSGYYEYTVEFVEYSCGYQSAEVKFHMASGGPVDIYEPSTGNFVGTYNLGPGMWRIEFSAEQYCTRVEFSSGTWVEWDGGGGGDQGGGDGGGSGGGDEPPPPPPSDTCVATGDNYGVLQNRWIQDSLNAALAESIASDTEIAGRILRHPVTGKMYFHRGVLDMAHTDNCSYKMLPASGLPGEVVAVWHTHPAADGTMVTCRINGTTGVVENGMNGGGSPKDWQEASASNHPFYTIDPDMIYRLDPDVPLANRSGNPYRWTRVPGGCAAPLPH